MSEQARSMQSDFEAAAADLELTDKKNCTLAYACVFFPFIAAVLLVLEHVFVPNSHFMTLKPYFRWLIFTSAIVFGAAALYGFYRPEKAGTFAEKAPLIAAFTAGFILWDLVTLKLGLLPLPYFPSPAAVLGSLVTEWQTLGISALYSLRLLFIGYGLGILIGLPTGVLMGWYPRVHYWVNPVLRIIGPIPATAWIPIAMVIFPTSFVASIFLLVLACWFPITVMTMSGVANVNKNYYEVARSLGASEAYLILKVALPAAMPTIFVGLFMSLGLGFITLIVAEMLGVKAGLGWFITWAQGWAEFSKVYAALIVMAFLFSSLITLLFRVRDRVLSWQKGLIKW